MKCGMKTVKSIKTGQPTIQSPLLSPALSTCSTDLPFTPVLQHLESLGNDRVGNYAAAFDADINWHADETPVIDANKSGLDWLVPLLWCSLVAAWSISIGVMVLAFAAVLVMSSSLLAQFAGSMLLLSSSTSVCMNFFGGGFAQTAGLVGSN
eukprot:TRINITY_DN34278_c0_g1_i1.p2 TRINITY_DN34278_c0_g1~~TRINITY_DN34278_c0_g1_i1.p2  ORF type:complete len:152 (+),score=45.24 TRINITY_DN34278_c0_g1_i1:100-555(+)